MGAPPSRKDRAVLASVSGPGASPAPSYGEPARIRVTAAPTGPGPASEIRPALPTDAQFLTVEPDGRDDVSFMDRLRHALRTVFAAVQKSDAAALATERALAATEDTLDAAAASGEPYFVQLRIVGVEVSYAEGDGGSAYASYRRLGLEIGVARGGSVRAGETAVVGLDGTPLDLTGAQLQSGLASGTYRRTESAPAAASERAGDRLAAARAGLERVRATQNALKAYRGGDLEPLRQLLEGERPGRGAAVFPGIGAVALN